ncbi:hypothetical protein [Vallitalea guaymasensis]|uniref:hypothetical protein n=1 Tax=Vallitalea guaymasensis TaxID=1185412 RepID=UPI00272B6A11|nr:hypothetical protein [Vallitalea guaymasensis]
MENEANSVLRQGVVLVVIAFIVGICWITVTCGQQLYRSMSNMITNGISSTYSSEIEAIIDYQQDLPTSSIYIALLKNSDSIRSISGGAHGIRVNSIDDLQLLFKYQINCDITKKNEVYDIVIKP